MYMLKYLAFTVGGQTINSPAGLPKPGNENAIISGAVQLFITICIVVTIIFVVWAGIKWITSGGDKQKVASARASLTWAIVGIVLVLIAILIVNVFSYAFGIELLNFNFG